MFMSLRNGPRFFVALAFAAINLGCPQEGRSQPVSSTPNKLGSPKFCQVRFVGTLVLTKTADPDEKITAAPFGFIDEQCNAWRVPRGMHTDGASIPVLAQYFVGVSFEDDYLPAAVLHDWYCDRRTQRWQDVHRMFYKAMRANGVPENKAKLMYTAVYLRGPRWNEQAVQNNDLVNTKVLPDIRQFDQKILEADSRVHIRNDILLVSPKEQALNKEIKDENLTLDQIDSRSEQIRVWYDNKSSNAWFRGQMDKEKSVVSNNK